MTEETKTVETIEITSGELVAMILNWLSIGQDDKEATWKVERYTGGASFTVIAGDDSFIARGSRFESKPIVRSTVNGKEFAYTIK